MKRLTLGKDKILFFISILLILLSLAYCIKGFYHLTLDKKGAIDLVFRWKEQQYIYRGLYPYDIRVGSPDIDPAIGSINSGGYPPWAFFTGFIFVPGVPLNVARYYFAALNLFSLVILAIFSYYIGIPYGRVEALFAMSACLAFGSNGTTLLNGQYGIIINAFLIGMYWALAKQKNVLAGLFLGIATIKPNISALYFFILIVRRQFKALSAFFIYIIGASLIIWLITKIDPIYMSQRIINQTKYFADEGYSSINVLTNLGIEPTIATLLLAAVGVLAITGIFYLWRNYSLLTLFAIASVIGRVWTYHRFYDNVMLVFFLLALIEMSFKAPRFFNFLMMMLVAITLWLPGRIVEIDNVGEIVESVQLVIWIAGLIYLLIQDKVRSSDSYRLKF